MKDRRDDSQAELRRIPTLFAQAESEDGQAPQSRNVPDAPRGGGPRARGPVLQISRLTVLDVQSVVMTGRRVTAGIGLALCVALPGCAPTLSGATMTTTTPNGTSEQIPVELAKPEGPGPFPAVVIMHDCSGLGPRSSGAPAAGPGSWSGGGTSCSCPTASRRAGIPTV